MVSLIALPLRRRGKLGDEKNTSRMAFVLHSLKTSDQLRTKKRGAIASWRISSVLSRLRISAVIDLELSALLDEPTPISTVRS